MSKFRFREFLIVLVICGAGYFIGKVFTEQLDNASIQNEISNIEKIVLAVNLYYTDIGKTSIVDTNAIAEEIVERDYITSNTLYSKYNNMYWVFTGCELEDNATRYTVTDNFSDNTSLCMYLSQFKTSNSNYTNAHTSSKYACYVETMADDSSLTSGDGRGNIRMNNGVGARIWDCEDETSPTAGEYLYKVY